MLSIKPTTLLVHILGWLFFLTLPVIFMMAQSSDDKNAIDIILNKYYLLYFVIFASIFYIHSQYLFTNLFFNKQYLLYVVALLLLFLAVFYIQPFELLLTSVKQMHQNGNRPDFLGLPPLPPPNHDFNFGPPPKRHIVNVDIISILFFVLMIGLGVVTNTSKRLRDAVQKAAEAEAEKANAELSFLKAQINPHFLFNTLNNIYSLAVIKDDNTPESIMKLSNIMRYVTDDGLENYVPLQREIDCITDYIDLQRLRLGSKVQLSFDVSGKLSDKQIAPLILITFIENVFKYGLSNNQHSVIIISISADERSINFYSENKIFVTHTLLERNGIGINNTKKRLQYLYPNKHLLSINQESDKFIVQLTLQL